MSSVVEIGDLVKLTRHTYQNGIVYRVMAKKRGRGRSTTGYGYIDCDILHLKPIQVLINAAPEITRHHTWQPETQVTRIDLLELGKTFSELETLIKEEVTRLSSDP